MCKGRYIQYMAICSTGVTLQLRKSTHCTVRMPSLTYARGHVGTVTNDWTLMEWVYLARTLLLFAKLFCTDLVSDMQHLIVASIVS